MLPVMLRTSLKRLLAPVLYEHPIPELPPERMYAYLDALWRTRDLPGAVVEVGCFQCGTAAWAHRMTTAAGIRRRYVCVDTFAGFPEDQFDRDVALGTSPAHRRGFRANSRALVEDLLDRWSCSAIELVEGDIAALPEAALPQQVAVALVDVDLEAPTYAALDRLCSRLSSGGCILVDDCSADHANPFRGARLGYQRFTSERGLLERYAFGMGWIGSVPPDFVQ